MTTVTEAIKSLETGAAATLKTHKDAIEALTDRLETLEAQQDRPKGHGASDTYSRDQREHLEKFNAWLRRPTEGSLKRQLDEAQSEMELKAQREGKGLAIAAGPTGGYAVPTILDSQIESRARMLNPFRSLVRSVTVGSRDWKALVSKNDSSSGWAAEAGARSETTTSDLVERAPTFGTLYAFPKATEEAMQDIFFDVAGWLTEEAGDGFAEAEASAIVGGNGSAKPTGFLAGTPVTTVDRASPERAAGTLRYLPLLSGSPESLNADLLIDLSLDIREKYLLDAERVAWVMSAATAAKVRKLKDSYGQYLWQPGLAAGQPPTLLGHAVAVTGTMPAPTAGQYPIAFGNWARGYIVCDRVGTMRITHDDNITTPGYHKFYIRKVTGGIVYNHEAIRVGKYAAS